MTNSRTRGIVLQVTDHGEADKIVSLYSLELGKVTGIAKGAKRSRKRFVNKLELCSLLQIHYRPARGDGLLFLSEAELENAYLPIRNRYDRYVGAMYAVELALRFTKEHDPDPQLFALLSWTMQALAEGRDPLASAVFFHLRLLGAVGYEPLLSQCGFCRTEVKGGEQFALHAGRGALICGNCRAERPGALLQVSVQTLKFLQHAQRTDLKNLVRLRLATSNAREALIILHRYTQHLLQQEIHGFRQLRSLDIGQPVA